MEATSVSIEDLISGNWNWQDPIYRVDIYEEKSPHKEVHEKHFGFCSDDNGWTCWPCGKHVDADWIVMNKRKEQEEKTEKDNKKREMIHKRNNPANILLEYCYVLSTTHNK